MDSLQSWSRALSATSANAAGRIGMNTMGKISLPQDCLEQLEKAGHQFGSMPLTLRIENKRKGLGTNVGVLDFSSDTGRVVLPDWLFTSLALQPGDSAVVSYTVLESADHCILKVLDRRFYKEVKDQGSYLERALRESYACLSRGDVIHLRAQSKAETIDAPGFYRILVQGMEPERSCSIIDTTMTVDVIPPDEYVKELEQKRQQLSNGEQKTIEIGSEDLEIALRDTGDGRTGESVVLIIPQEVPVAVTVNVLHPQGADIEGYLDEEHASDDIPNRWHHKFAPAEDEVSSVRFNFKSLGPGRYTLGIHGFESDVLPMVNVSCAYDVESDQPGTQTLKGPSAADSAPEGYKLCLSCGQLVPDMNYERHEIFCQRNNVKCDTCGKVLQRKKLREHRHCETCGQASESDAQAKKHHLIRHSEMKCLKCGATKTDMEALQSHNLLECSKRSVKCRYCGDIVEAGQPVENHRDRMMHLTEHEVYCGSRTMACTRCGQKIQMKQMEAHMKLHEMESANPTTTQENFDRIREEAWARAYGLEVPARQSPPSGSGTTTPVSMDVDVVPKPTVPKTYRVCTNSNCTEVLGDNQAKVAFGLCRECHTAIGAGRSYQELLGGTIRSLHSSITVGCGDEKCMNRPICQSSIIHTTDPDTIPRSGTEAGVKALALARDMLSKAEQIGGINQVPGPIALCVDQDRRQKAAQVHRLTDMGFPFPLCVQAQQECPNEAEMVSWLLQASAS
eukprot:Clim_evm2s118 gene=Clim_evmTU2s118